MVTFVRELRTSYDTFGRTYYAGGNHYASRLEGGRILYFRGNFQKPGLGHNALFLLEFPERLTQPKRGNVGRGKFYIHDTAVIMAGIYVVV